MIRIGKILKGKKQRDFLIGGREEPDYQCEENEKLQITFNDIGFREVVFCFGKSGVGKSTLARQYLDEYRKINKKNNIYIFSAKSADPVLDKGLKNSFRIPLDDAFMDSEISYDNFQDSISLFDDIDTLSKPILKKVKELMRQFLELGRDKKISVFYISHAGCNRDETKTILNEATHTIFMPSKMNEGDIDYFLRKKVGLNGQSIKKLERMSVQSDDGWIHYVNIGRFLPVFMCDHCVVSKGNL